MLDKNTIMLVAIFASDMLIQTGVVPEPKTQEEADSLLKLVSTKFLLFTLRAVAEAQGSAGAGCDCGACPDAAHCPDRSKN